MNFKLTRREMIETLGGGLGVVGLAGVFAGLSRSEVHAAGLGNYAGPALPAKAKHVIMLYLNGGPSQLDMFDPKPALFKYAGQRPNAVDLRTERDDRRAAAVAVRVQALRTQRRRGERAAAAARERHRRHLRHSIDVHVQPDAHAGTRPVPHRQRAGDAAVDGIVDYVRARVGEREPAVVRRAWQRHGGGPQTRSGIPADRSIRAWAFAVADPDPEKIIPNLRNKNVDADAQRADMDALLRLNQSHSKSFGADQFLEGRIKSMETAYRMQFEALDLFDIRKEPQQHPRGIRPRARSATAACWRGGWSKPACATSTSIIRAGRSGTTIAT